MSCSVVLSALYRAMMNGSRLPTMTLKERTPPMATAKFVSLNITPEAREAVRRMAVLVTAETEQRCTHSEALLIAEAVLRAHRGTVAALAASRAESSE